MHKIIEYVGIAALTLTISPIRSSYIQEHMNEQLELIKQTQVEIIEETKEEIPPIEVEEERISRGEVEEPISQTWDVSFYCNCISCCGKTDGITASGEIAMPWYTIAMNKDYPMGTKLYIEEFDTTFVKQDVGGAIVGNKIDIFVRTHEEALRLGRKQMKGYIVE